MYSPVLSLPMLQRLALEAIVENMERFLANYKPLPSKTAETSESEQEKSRKYENEKRKRAFNPSWKTSFAWLEYHVMNDEGKMLCNICRRYDRSGSFSVGNMNFKVHITYFFYSLIRIYTSSNDVPRINFLTQTQHNFFMIFQIL